MSRRVLINFSLLNNCMIIVNNDKKKYYCLTTIESGKIKTVCSNDLNKLIEVSEVMEDVDVFEYEINMRDVSERESIYYIPKRSMERIKKVKKSSRREEGFF